MHTQNLRKATVNFVMYVCPSGRLSAWNKTAHHLTDFHEIRYLSIFSKIFRENIIIIKI